MGLRMYRDPDEVDTKPPAIKTDPTAPARSAIRRQRTVRYSSNTRQPSFQNISSTTYRPGSTYGRMRTPSDRRSLLEDIRRREGAPNNQSQYAVNEVADLEGALQENSYARAADIAHTQASQRTRLESGRALLRDALSYERPGDRVRISRSTNVTDAPESRRPRRRSPASGQFVEELDNLTASRRNHWPIPPYTSGGSSDNSPVHRSTPPLGTASLTPRFAPAHRLSDDADGESTTAGQTLATRQDSLALLAERIPSLAEVVNREDRVFLSTLASELESMRDLSPEILTMHYLNGEAAYLENVEMRLNELSVNSMGEIRAHPVDGLSALRRMDHPNDPEARTAAVRRQLRRSRRAPTRQDALDGLGDRQRSFSPDDDTWDTMLMTITPDERVPSAHSSFTTASASATSLSSNSATSSYGTLVTAPSTYADIEACPAESSDSDEDEVFHLIEDFIPIEGVETRRREAGRLNASRIRLPWPGHQSRLDELSRRVAEHRADDDQFHGRPVRDNTREGELRRLESSLRSLDRQLAEERAGSRQRPDERL